MVSASVKVGGVSLVLLVAMSLAGQVPVVASYKLALESRVPGTAQEIMTKALPALLALHPPSATVR